MNSEKLMNKQQLKSQINILLNKINNLNNNKIIKMKNLIVTIFVLTIVNLSFAQIHVVKPNGDVGIGTKNPTQKLEINGNLKTTGGFVTTGSNSKGVSKILVGSNRTTEGISFIDFVPGLNGSEYGRFITQKKNGVVSSSLHHHGAGNFNIRAWNSTSKIKFITSGNGNALTILANGRIGMGLDNPTAQLQITGGAKKPGGGEWAATSDKRTKKNINSYEAGLTEVLELNPVTYNYNGKAGINDTEKTHIGLIAQEFEEIAPYAIEKFEYTEEGSNKTEEYLSLDASSIKYMLVNAIKEQQALIETQQQLAETQQKEIESLKEQISKLVLNEGTATSPIDNQMSIQLEGNGAENALLAQNTPNPFTTFTRIEYFIPENSRHCRLSFRDMNGKEINQVDINHEGVGVVDLSAKDLAAGIYSYVLYVNGDIVASKKMILKQ